jgi:hypothetical protein
MEIYNFMTETTRRCNMKCSHCLRGEPENKSMLKTHLRLFLSQVNFISNAAFTGGEPTLPSGIKAIYDFMDVCEQYGVDVGSFYIATNAKVSRPEIPILINDLYKFCSDNDVSYIDISTDQYHDPIESQRETFVQELEEELEYTYGITNVVSQRASNLRSQHLLSEGRAFTNRLVNKPYAASKPEVENNSSLKLRQSILKELSVNQIIKGIPDWRDC